jgi:hypothetical protein
VGETVISTYHDGLHGSQDRAMSEPELVVLDLRRALNLGPILSGSLTLNFDDKGEFQSFDTKTHRKVKKSVDSSARR